jgi:hypothetical protein
MKTAKTTPKPTTKTENKKPGVKHQSIGELFRSEKEMDEMSLFSGDTAVTHNPLTGNTRSHVQIKPSEKDPVLTQEIASDFFVRLYKNFSGLCCGLPGNYAMQMFNSRNPPQPSVKPAVKKKELEII